MLDIGETVSLHEGKLAIRQHGKRESGNTLNTHLGFDVVIDFSLDALLAGTKQGRD